MSIDIEKGQREDLRWLIITTLNAARPVGAPDILILTCVNDVLRQVTMNDLRKELDYLHVRHLIELEAGDRPVWHAKLTRDGVDVAEYTVEVEPGIARPKKYW